MSKINNELIKEAIADAKAVRATALQNAKVALEEVFSSQVTQTLSEKLREDIEESDNIGAGSSAPDASPTKPSIEKVTTNAGSNAGQKFEKWLKEEEGQEEVVASEVVAGDRAKVGDAVPAGTAPVDGSGDEENITAEEIDQILKELEEDAGAPEAPVAPAPVDPTAVAPAPSPVDPTAVAQAPVAPVNTDPTAVAPTPAEAPVAPAPVAETDEEIDLNELLTSLNEEEEEEGKIEEVKEVKEVKEEEEEGKKEEEESLKKENTEFRKTIEFLREQLNDVNLLNAKLLYTNKLFKANNLNREQKMKVIEQFDLNKTIREVKLTYSNLTEALNLSKTPAKKTAAGVITEGFASKPVGTTKPSGNIVIPEANDMVVKFQKLAGITK